MSDRNGQIFGNYRLLQPLGHGGFAEVYLAEHLHLQTYAAIKFLHGPVTTHDLQTFTREARIIARLQHPNIIRILDFGIQENVPFLIMDYAPHGTLHAKHPKGEKLPLPVVVSYVQQLANALHYAHEHKIIHRDIKPANMLLGKQQDVLLSDFGVSAIIQSTSSQGTNSIAGTIIYMAPEQIQGRAIPASDQYSLAVVVYEWLCGTPPFRGSIAEIAFQHYTAPPPPLSKHVSTIPTAVESVVLKALTKNPQQRFPNVQNFASALEQASTEKLSPTWPLYSLDHIRKQGEWSVLSPTNDASRKQEAPGEISQIRSVVQHRPYLTRRTVVAGLVGLTLVGTASAVFLARTPIFPHPDSHNTSLNKPAANLPTHPASTSSPASTQAPALPSAIYAGGTDKYLYALHPQNGNLLWSFQAQDWMNSRPVVGKGVVYAGSSDHSLYALRANDGALIWRSQTADKIVSWPMLVNNVLYFGSWDGFVYAIRAEDGSVLWKYQTGGFISSPTQVVNGIVYIGSSDQYLYALQASNGTLLWRFYTGAIIAALATIYQGVVYIGSGDHSLYALRARDGAELWHFQTGDAIYSAPEIVDGVLYIGSNDHFIYALRLNDQAELWRFQTGGAVASLPTVSNGILYAGSSDGFVYALQTQDGTVLWRYQTGGFVSSKAVLANGIAYVGGSNGLFAMRTHDGSLVWQFGNAAFTTPTLAVS